MSMLLNKGLGGAELQQGKFWLPGFNLIPKSQKVVNYRNPDYGNHTIYLKLHIKMNQYK